MKRLVLGIAMLTLAAAALAETTAIVGAKVHTVGPQGTLESATIVMRDGKIVAVGNGVNVPDDAIVIDAAGKIVTPGLFSPIGRLGLIEVSNSAGPADALQRGEQFTAGFDIADAYNANSTLVAINRIEGVTRALIAPSPGNPDDFGAVGHVLSGQAAVVNLGNGNGVDRPRAAMVVTLGESGSGLSGGSRATAWLTLRNALDEARDYGDHKGDFERGMRRDYVHSITDLEALQGVISGAIPMLVELNRASDIEVLIELCANYGTRAIINGGAEAWMLADELATADIAVLVSTTNNLPGNFDQLNARRGAANILAAAGVRFALTDGQSQTHNARNITQSAGNAVADGLDWNAALHAITLAPAEIYGVGAMLGSIEPGKAADVVLWSADPLELSNYPEQVFINGVAVPMQSRQTLLRDRYLQLDSKIPPAYRN